MIDFNDAEEQQEYGLIPYKTIAKVQLTIKRSEMSGSLPRAYITTSRDGQAAYLNCEFTILEGPYKKRKVFDNFGIQGKDIFVNMGRTKIRALLESFHGISSKDTSDTAKSKRMINDYGQLDELIAVAEIGVRKANLEKGYEEKNNIFRFLTIDDKEYADVMGQTSLGQARLGVKDFNHREKPNADIIDDSIQF